MARQPREIVDGTYLCNKCFEVKPVSDFYPDKVTRTRLRGSCKVCDIKKVNAQHTHNLSRALRNLWVRHKSNGVHGSKRRQEFTAEGCITPELLMEMWKSQEARCAVTGCQLTHIQGKGFRVWTNVTLDRINNDRGYVRDNIRLVCRAANYMKAGMSDTEMVEWAQAIIKGPIAAGLPQCSKLSEPPEGDPRSEGERNLECLTIQ